MSFNPWILLLLEHFCARLLLMRWSSYEMWLLNNETSFKTVLFLNVIIVFACYPFQSEKMVTEADVYLL